MRDDAGSALLELSRQRQPRLSRAQVSGSQPLLSSTTAEGSPVDGDVGVP